MSQPAPSPSQQLSPAPPQPTQQVRPASAPSQRFRPAPQPSQQFRPAPQPSPKFRPAPQPSQQFRPAPQPTQQFRPASQTTQQFRPAPELSHQFRPAHQQSFQQLTPNVQQSPSQVQSQFSLQTVIGSQQSQGTIPASTQTLRVFAPEPSSVRQPEQRNNQQLLSVESTRFFARPAPAPVARPNVAPRQEVQPARVETTALASSRDYEHDNTGDNELSRFQLYQLKKKQGQQFRPVPQPTQQSRPRTAPQPQVAQDIVNNEVILHVCIHNHNLVMLRYRATGEKLLSEERRTEVISISDYIETLNCFILDVTFRN